MSNGEEGGLAVLLAALRSLTFIVNSEAGQVIHVVTVAMPTIHWREGRGYTLG
jgi:hypothetical protein